MNAFGTKCEKIGMNCRKTGTKCIILSLFARKKDLLING